jgi:epoxyqueuosine reductase QueG
MHTCSLCRRDLPEAAPQQWTTDDGEVVFVEERTADPSAVVDTSGGEITVCDQCYSAPLPSWLTRSDLRELHYQFGLECRDHGGHFLRTWIRLQ